MLVAFKAIARGEAHKEKGSPCQDSAYCFLSAGKSAARAPVLGQFADICFTADYSTGIALVADGHGGEKYLRSERGSRFACDNARQVLWNFSKAWQDIVQEAGFFDKNLPVCEADIIRRWNLDVSNDFKKNKLTGDERAACERLNIDPEHNEADRYALYGTTLLAALVTREYWFVLQIGDGKCVVIDENGKAYTPPRLAPDDGEGFGLTHSICLDHAAKHFKHAFGFNRILGLTVATDGVADSFLPEKYLDFTLNLRENFVKTPGAAAQELQAFLPRLSEQGSRDDVAIAGVFRDAEDTAHRAPGRQAG